jgi:hypothetical protein
LEDCDLCESFFLIFEETAWALKKSPNLIFGSYNLDFNEIPFAYFVEVPLVLFYRGCVLDEGIIFKGQRSKKELIKFLQF